MIQFNINHLFALSLNVSFIQHINETLSGDTNSGSVALGVTAMKGYFAVTKAPVLREPRHQIV